VMPDNSRVADQADYVEFPARRRRISPVNRHAGDGFGEDAQEREQELSFLEFNYMCLQATTSSS